MDHGVYIYMYAVIWANKNACLLSGLLFIVLTLLSIDPLFKSLHNRYCILILTPRKQYYSNSISSANPRCLWQTIAT